MNLQKDSGLDNQYKEKNILVFVQHMTDGGAERVLSELISYWYKKGARVTVVETTPKKFKESYYMPDGVEDIKLPNTTIKLIDYAIIYLSMIRIMRKNPKASVLAFTEAMILKLALTFPFVKNRIVLSLRNDPVSTPESKVYRRLRDWAFQKSDANVFQTTDAMHYFPQEVWKKSVIIPNPINPDIPDMYSGLREKKIVAAGRLTGQKNFKMLINAFSRLHKDFPDYCLYIYGRGELEGELRKQAEDLGIADSVVFPGFSEHIYQDIRKSALYVSSSDFEGISNSMLEALALGLPSVVTDCPAGGARLAINDHENGILVPIGDEQALYIAMKYMLENPEEAIRMGKNAAQIRERWPIEKIADRWLELF